VELEIRDNEIFQNLLFTRKGGELMVNMTATINLMPTNPKKASKSNIADKASGNFQELLSLMQEEDQGDSTDIVPAEIQNILLQLINLNRSENKNNIVQQNENLMTPTEISPEMKERLQQVWLYLVKVNELEDNDSKITKFYNELKELVMYFSQSDLKDNDLEIRQLLDSCSDIVSNMGKDGVHDENINVHFDNIKGFIAQSTYFKEALQRPTNENTPDFISEGKPIKEFGELIPKANKSKENSLKKDVIEIIEEFTLNEYPLGDKLNVDTVENLSAINPNQDPMKFKAEMNTPEISNNMTSPFEKEDLPIQPQEVLDQIIDRLETAANGSEKQISVRLKPEYLGEMVIKIYTNQDEVRAQMFIKNDFTRDIIQLNVAELKKQVAQQGINLTEVDFYDMQDTGMTRDFSNGSYQGNSDHSGREHLYYKYEAKELTPYSKSKTSNFLDLECNVNYVI